METLPLMGGRMACDFSIHFVVVIVVNCLLLLLSLLLAIRSGSSVSLFPAAVGLGRLGIKLCFVPLGVFWRPGTAAEELVSLFGALGFTGRDGGGRERGW